MRRSATAVVAMTLVFSATLAFAQDEKPPIVTAEVVIAAPIETRPAALIPLYVGQAGLQAYDGWATIYGVRRGANETNPLVGGLASHPAVFWSLKAVSTVASIYGAETLWRAHHRGQAIALLVVANGVMAAVAARDASILKSLKSR